MATNDFRNRYTISSQGLRDDLVEDIDEFRILAVGDSFTGGEGVEANETWPKQLQSKLNARANLPKPIRVINGGVTGYSVRQMRLMTQELVPKFKPEVVIVAVFSLGLDRIENEFAMYGGHLVRTRDVPNITPYKNGYIWYRSTLANPLLASMDLWCQKFAHFPAYALKVSQRYGVIETVQPPAIDNDPGTESKEINALSDELSAISKFLDAQQIELLVMIVNQQEKDGSFSARGRRASDRIHELCGTLDIQCLDPTNSLIRTAQDGTRLRFENDAHWSRAAHEVAADVLFDSLLIDSAASQEM